MSGKLIILAKDHDPVFPDLCVGCGAAPSNTVRVASETALDFIPLAFLFPGHRRVVEAPACDHCGMVMRRHQRIRSIIFVMSMTLMATVATWLFRWYAGPFRRAIMAGVIFSSMVPTFIWDYYVPPLFGMWEMDEGTRYDLQCEEFAAEFAALNAESLVDLPDEDES